MHFGVVILGEGALVRRLVGQLVEHGAVCERRGDRRGVDIHAIFLVVVVYGVHNAAEPRRNIIEGAFVDNSGNEELVAAYPYYDVVFAGSAGKRNAEGLKHLVALRVAVGVVYAAEVLNVDGDYAQQLLRVVELAAALRHDADVAAHIQQTREGIAHLRVGNGVVVENVPALLLKGAAYCPEPLDVIPAVDLSALAVGKHDVAVVNSNEVEGREDERRRAAALLENLGKQHIARELRHEVDGASCGGALVREVDPVGEAQFGGFVVHYLVVETKPESGEIPEEMRVPVHLPEVVVERIRADELL